MGIILFVGHGSSITARRGRVDTTCKTSMHQRRYLGGTASIDWLNVRLYLILFRNFRCLHRDLKAYSNQRQVLAQAFQSIKTLNANHMI
jgi:hypothetical protein